MRCSTVNNSYEGQTQRGTTKDVIYTEQQYDKLPQTHKPTAHVTGEGWVEWMVLPIKLRSEKTMQSKSGGKNEEEREKWI